MTEFLFTTERPLPIRPVDDPLFVSCSIIRIVMSVFIIVGNGCVLVSFKLYPELRTSTGWLIAGLSMADLIGSGNSTLMAILPHYRNSDTWILLCHIKMALQNPFVIGNIGFSMIIAIERFITLQYPLIYMTIITTERIAYCTIGMWVYISTLSILIPILIKDHLPTIEQTDCLIANSFTPLAQYIVMAHVYVFLCVVFIFYILIARIAWKKRHAPAAESSSKAQWKITKMMAIVFMVYGLFYIPIIITERLTRMYPYSQVNYDLYFIFTVAYTCNSWINPILYAIKDKSYQRGFRKMLPDFLSRRCNTKIDTFE